MRQSGRERSDGKVHMVIETNAGLSCVPKADGSFLPKGQQMPLL